MPMTDAEMIALLRADEPNFTALAPLVSDALPVLRRLIESGDPEIATKAAGLAGTIDEPERAEVLGVALGHGLTTVRMAAARSAAKLPVEQAQPLLSRALADADAGVRAVAVRALPNDAARELRDEVRTALENESDQAVRDLMRNVISPK
jgi:HEAT repeat protein